MPYRLALLLPFLVACGETTIAPSADAAAGAAPSCVPDEATWATEVQPIVEARCTTCHGEVPDFGAPFSLTAYAPLLDGEDGSRIVDRMATQIAAGTMPPEGAPDPTIAERDAIVRWASCGAQRVEDPVGTRVSRPPFAAPETAPEGLETVDLTAAELAIGPNVRDLYEPMFFTGVVDREVFVRRFEAIIDESRVVHHLTLQRERPGSAMRYLYTWAPGTGAFEFPDGGIRLGPEDRLRLEIHYNNGAGVPDVRDSSGVRLFVGETEGTEYLMSDPGPGAFGFAIAARSERTVETTCQVREDVTALAAMPHMHEIGDTFEVLVDGEVELRLDGWSFENQLFYALPLELRAGQELTVRCGYWNPTSERVVAGLGTSDEMCFAFTYITPPVQDLCR